MPAVTVVGNISEPNLEFGGPENKARCSFSIAENHSRWDKDRNEYVATGTTWYRVTLWESFAENFANEFTRGQRVIAEGRSYTRAYTDKNGNEGNSFELHVNNIGKALSKRPPQGQQPSSGFSGGFSNQPPQQPQADVWGGTGQQAAPQQAQADWSAPQQGAPAF